MEVDLQACIAGDKQAWDDFVARWSGVIHAAVARAYRTYAAPHRASEQDDVVQDVFIRLVKDDFRLLGKYDPDRASLSTWLTIVARSVAIDRLRLKRIEPAGVDFLEHVASENTSTHAEADSQDVPLDILTPRQRLVIRLLFAESMPVAEAARMVGVDEQTIRSTKHKALSRLRGHMATEAARENAGSGSGHAGDVPPESRVEPGRNTA